MNIGEEVPSAFVAILDNDLPVSFDIRNLLTGHRCLIIGAPQAFTPICSKTHVPEIACDLERYRALGFDRFLVIAPDNPWTMKAWQRHFPEAEEFIFLSDGNMDFVRTCGLTERCAGLFLGECSKRYVIQTTGTRVEHIDVEESVLVVSRTGSQAQLHSLVDTESDSMFEIVDA
ncbi:MAG: redoxin family protein [Alphaproteobacteria bacterium]|jgi:peroxiredoxin|uniref:redoxin family protein n=1 Tax=Pacificispira sp. TaxID=2888761 RepID=UPI001B0C3BD4|nr:redoxin family protein [Alphaproteobacteria bacterium]MBO6865194.1 redoxin family protein [Alphaproteobacteria bacterium]MEC9267202.1 redoxin family protein [Pseudomonadota bacterium]